MYKALAILCLLGAVYADVYDFPRGEYGSRVGMRPGKMPKHIGLLELAEGECPPDQDPLECEATMANLAVGTCPADEPECDRKIHIEIGDIDIGIDIHPEHKSGETIWTTDLLKMDNALDEVLKSGGVDGHNRRCAIAIANRGPNMLINPHYYLFAGEANGPTPPEIKKGHSGLMLFQKITSATRGSIGVLTYEIENTNHKLAVMWSIPHDFAFYDPQFNMKLYPKDMATDKDMYEQLYYNAGAYTPHGRIEKREDFGTVVEAQMNHDSHAKFEVWVDTTNYDENGSVHLWTDCKYHPGWVAHFCTQEKYPKGWCWADKVRCKNGVSDCQNGPYSCR